MTFTSHTATNQSTVSPEANHMSEWPASITKPLSLLVENVRTDEPAYFGSDEWGDTPEWDEPAEVHSIVTLTMPNGATMVMVAPEPGDCFDPEVTQEGNWSEYIEADDSNEGVEVFLFTALCDARNEAIDKWRK